MPRAPIPFPRLVAPPTVLARLVRDLLATAGAPAAVEALDHAAFQAEILLTVKEGPAAGRRWHEQVARALGAARVRALFDPAAWVGVRAQPGRLALRYLRAPRTVRELWAHLEHPSPAVRHEALRRASGAHPVEVVRLSSTPPGPEARAEPRVSLDQLDAGQLAAWLRAERDRTVLVVALARLPRAVVPVAELLAALARGPRRRLVARRHGRWQDAAFVVEGRTRPIQVSGLGRRLAPRELVQALVSRDDIQGTEALELVSMLGPEVMCRLSSRRLRLGPEALRLLRRRRRLDTALCLLGHLRADLRVARATVAAETERVVAQQGLDRLAHDERIEGLWSDPAVAPHLATPLVAGLLQRLERPERLVLLAARAGRALATTRPGRDTTG